MFNLHLKNYFIIKMKEIKKLSRKKTDKLIIDEK